MTIYKLELTGEELQAAIIAIVRMSDRVGKSNNLADKARANFLDEMLEKLWETALEQEPKYEE